MSKKDFISKMGYRDDSPYRGMPSLNIKTPSGFIDMSKTGIPLLANGRLLPPYSGQHFMGTTNVTEIPVPNLNLPEIKQQNTRGSLNINPYHKVLSGNISHNLNDTTTVRVNGILPMQSEPSFGIGVGFKFKEGGEFEPHMMYDPESGKGYMANTYEDHLRMKEMGYLHEGEMQKAEGGSFQDGGGIFKNIKNAYNKYKDVRDWYKDPNNVGEENVDNLSNWQKIKNVANWRENLAENLNPRGYDAPIERLYKSIVLDRPSAGSVKGPYSRIAGGSDYWTDKERQDLLQIMLNKPQVHNTIEPQRAYWPTNAKENPFERKNPYYRSKRTEMQIRDWVKKNNFKDILNTAHLDEELANGNLKELVSRMAKYHDVSEEELAKRDAVENRYQYEFMENYGHVLGNYTMDYGIDPRDGREYISYYDKWNINPTDNYISDDVIDKTLNLQSPEIYGRVYLDDIDSDRPPFKTKKEDWDRYRKESPELYNISEKRNGGDNPFVNLVTGKGEKILANNVVKGMGHYFGTNAVGRGVSSFLTNPYLLPVAAGVEGINFMGTEEGESIVNEQKTIDNVIDDNDGSQSLKTWGIYPKYKEGGLLDKYQVKGEIEDAEQFMFDWTNSPMHMNMLKKEDAFNANFIKRARLNNLYTQVGNSHIHDEQPLDRPNLGGTSNSLWADINLYPTRDKLTAVHEYSHASDRNVMPFNYEYVKSPYLKSANDFINPDNSIYDKMASTLLNVGKHIADPFGIAGKFVNDTYHNITGNDIVEGANYLGRRLIPDSSNDMVSNFRFNEDLKSNYSDFRAKELLAKYKKYKDIPYTPDNDFGAESEKEYNEMIEGLKTGAQTSTDWADYVAEPTETRARINSIRKSANDLGIYDVFNEPISKEQFEELLNQESNLTDKPGFNPLGQLQGIFSNDEIFKMLNTFSDASDEINNELSDEVPVEAYAQDGKELNGMEVLTSILPEGKSPEIDAFGYRGYFDFDQAPIQMSDNDDGHLGYLFVYTEGPTAGGSYWRPVNSQYQGGRWEDSGQIEEYEAYFKNSDLIDKHWDKGSAVGNRIREAVENNVLYSELPEYLKDYNTWRTISPDRDLEKELDDLIKEQDGSEITFEDIEKGIRHVESSDGKLMKNRQSSASGFYGQLFNNIDYDGTRDEFIADVEFQKDLFKKRFNGEIEGVPGLKSNGIDIYNEYKDQLDLELTPTQIAALSNLLGRQGTREYIGNVLRDGKTLTEVFPHLYGKDKGAVNKTPSEYIELFNNALLKRKGGEFSKKLSRLKQQLKLYEEGGTISPLAYQELVKLRLIKPEFAGGGSYTVKKGDSLSAIAKANEIKLSELLELNPDYKAKPEFVQIGANIKIPASAASEDESNDNDESITYTVKSGDNLSSIGREKGVSWRDIAKLNDLDDPNSISVNQQLKMPEIPNIVPNNETQKNILEQENNISTSVYSPQGAPDPDAFSTEQSWVDWGMTDNDTYTSVGGKRNKIRDINKMDQADLIVNSVNDNHTDMSDISHTIESGQTLSGISAEYNVPMNRIMEDNNITDPNQINEGSNLKINKSSGDPYIIVDEKSGRMHLYYPGETEPSKSYPILTGANSGDAQTVTQIQYFDPDGNTIDDKEAFEDDMKTLKPGYRSKVNWDWGNKTTGAGVYTIDFANDNSGGYDETGRGRKTPSFVLNNDNNKNVSTAIHVVSNIPGENRVDRLYNRGEFAGDTDNNESNRITNGCINGTCSAMIDLYENPDVKKGTKVFILSDNPEENNFVYENGQVNFRASSDERTDALNYIDEEGTERKGQGINVSTKTLDYKPINFVIDKGAIGNSETFDGSVENEEMEFQTNTVPYIESLSKNKQTLMKDFGINGDRYNDLALIAFGIYGAESKLGDENSAGENAAKYSMAALNKLGNYVGLDIGGKTGPDVTSEWNYPGITGEDNSVGPTQIVWNQLDPTEKGMLAKLGIESNTDLKDPSNAAQATMVLLNKRLTQTKRIKIKGQEQADGTYTFPEQYDGYLTGSGSDRYLDVQGYRKSSDFDIFSFAPTLWNKADYYPGKVSKYMRFANLQETDIDTVDPEVIVKGEFNQENENFKDLAMEYLTTPNPMPAINSIKEGISGATQVAADAAVNVGNQIVSGVQNATKGVSDWYKTADLNPFWKSGGELFETNAQQRFYEDYISGSYKGTKQSDKAKKLFEKLNRIYYNDSKDKNLHQLDIIKGINQQ